MQDLSRWGRGLRPPFFMILNHSKTDTKHQFRFAGYNCIARFIEISWDAQKIYSKHAVSIQGRSEDPAVCFPVEHLRDDLRDILGIRNES